MSYENITLENKNGIGIITINRPNALNALNSKTLQELDKAVEQVKEDDSIFVVILTGSGDKAFVAGADISEMKEMNVIEGRKFGILGNKVFRELESLEKPVIAAVNGFALGGGCELAMSCDIRIASPKAKFGQPEVGLGITPGFGGTQRLPRLVGTGLAKELLYTARVIGAEEAYRIGLVNSIVAAESSVLDEAIKLAEEIMKNAPIAVKLCKQAVNRGMQTDIDTGIAFEAEVFGACFSTEDQTEGMGAFVEKRKDKAFKNK